MDQQSENQPAGTEAPKGYAGDLKRKTKSSIVWTLVRIASDQLFSFLVFVVMARLLTKHEVGTFAVALIFSDIGRIIATGGMTQSIARSKVLTPAISDTVFWTNLGMAVIIALIMSVAAEPIATAINQPEAGPILRALGCVPMISALGATHLAMRLREFGHKTMAWRSLLGGTIGGSVAITAAFMGAGVWSLVIQRFTTEMVSVITAWHAYRWKPGRNFSRTEWRRIAGLGTNLTITQLIFLMLVRVQDLVIGITIGTAAVGTYRTAWRTTELINNAGIQPFTTVALQTLSRLQDDRDGLVKAYQWMISTSSLICFPALVGFGVVAPEAIPLIYGQKWAEAGQLAQVFALMVVPFCLNFFASPVLTAMGKGRSIRTLALVQLGLTVALTWFVAPYGIFAVACAYVFRAYLTLPLQIFFLKRGAGITLRDTIDAVAAPFLASSAMGIVVWVGGWLLRPYLPEKALLLAILVPVGVATYATLVLVFSRRAREALARARTKLKAYGL
jgi:O-antigen/teichoic acid export membrane protein